MNYGERDVSDKEEYEGFRLKDSINRLIMNYLVVGE